MISVLVWIIGLTAVFALTVASGQPEDLLTGAVVSSVTVFLLRDLIWPNGAASRQLTLRRVAGALIGFPGFFLATIRDMTVGTWVVGMVVLGVRPLREPGVVIVPVDDRSEAGAVVTAIATTISPGELAVWHDTEKQELHMHLVDAGDPDAVRARHKWLYEKFQRRFVP